MFSWSIVHIWQCILSNSLICGGGGCHLTVLAVGAAAYNFSSFAINVILISWL